MNTNKIAVFLSVIFIFSFVTACGSDGTDAVFETGAVSQDEPISEPETDYLDTLGTIDMSGQTIRITAHNTVSTKRVLLPESSENGEPVNDALYRRDREIEERYGINFSYIPIEESDALLSATEKSIMAGSDDYDIIFANMNPVAQHLTVNNELISFDRIPFVDLSREWWCSYNDTLTLGGKQYFPSGIITPMYYDALYVLLYNKRLADNYNLENMYPIVTGGSWTIDKLTSMMSGVTADLNGDGKFDLNDQWALAYDDVAGFGFYIGTGQNMTRFDEEGMPYLSMNTPESVSVINRLCTAIGDRASALRGEDYAKNSEGDLFFNGQALFVGQTLAWVPRRYREMEDDYGILPMPKLDESQTEYYSYSQPWTGTGVCVPATNSKIDITGLVIETMAYLSDTYIREAAYETNFKSKMSRDSESAQMLDITAASSTFDLNVIFNWGGTADILRDAVLGRKGDFVSKYSKVEEKANNQIEDLITTLKDFE